MKILVIGAGYWGPNIIRNLVGLPEVEAVGVCDLDPTRVQAIVAQFPRTHAAKPVPEAFADGYDAAVIVTPVQTHAALAQAALEHGLHVFVEKPLTRSSAEAETLIRLAEEKRRILMVGHVFHYKAEVRKLAELVASGVLGEIRYVDATRVNLGIFRPDVNVAWDLAPHDLTILEAVFGRSPRRVSAVGATHVKSNLPVMQKTMVHLLLDYGNEALARIHVNWFSPVKQRLMVIAGDKKMAVYDDLSPSESLKVYDCGTYDPTQDTPAYPTLRTGETFVPHLQHVEPLKREMQEFLAAIKEARSPATDGKAGLRVVKILEAAERSMEQQGIFIDLDPQAE
jgi:predicted dehydrogenase